MTKVNLTINRTVMAAMMVVLLVLVAMALGTAQQATSATSTASGLGSGGGIYTTSGAGMLTLTTPIDVVDLDRSSNIYCEGWDYAKAAPVGCHEPPALVITVRYTGKLYHLSRAELIDAVKRQLAAKGK